MKKFKKLLMLSFCLVVLTAVFSCSKDDDNKGPHNVEFKVTTSSNASIKTVVYSNAQGDATSATGLSGNNWSTKVTVNADVTVVAITASAEASSTSGTMTVQILVDGKVVKENTATGDILASSTSYAFVN